MRTLRKILAKIHATGERNLPVALRAAVQMHNSTVHMTTKFTPIEAEKPHNQAQVLLNIEKEQHKFLAQYYQDFDRLNKKFSVSDLVRKILRKDPFLKESQDLFSPELHRIANIIPSRPLHGYKLQDLSSGVIIPGSWTHNQLLK